MPHHTAHHHAQLHQYWPRINKNIWYILQNKYPPKQKDLSAKMNFANASTGFWFFSSCFCCSYPDVSRKRKIKILIKYSLPVTKHVPQPRQSLWPADMFCLINLRRYFSWLINIDMYYIVYWRAALPPPLLLTTIYFYWIVVVVISFFINHILLFYVLFDYSHIFRTVI